MGQEAPWVELTSELEGAVAVTRRVELGAVFERSGVARGQQLRARLGEQGTWG